MDTDVIIIGAGVIGLASGYYLSKSGLRVVIIEKEKNYGLATSSRSTEVIHSGAYYKKGSLKGKLCLRGKALLYEYCIENKIPHKRIPKLFLAQDEKSEENLLRIQKLSVENGLKNTKIINKNDIKKIEPLINGHMALLSPSSGIFDTSSFMHSLARKCEDNGVIIAQNSKFLDAQLFKDFIRIRLSDQDDTSITSKFVINAAGLEAVKISKKVFQEDLSVELNPVKGCYARYKKKLNINHIIYPSFSPGQITERVDCTPDLHGILRFGPSLEKNALYGDLSIPEDLISRFENSIKEYIPSIERSKIQVDYAAFRPKIILNKDNNPDFTFNSNNDFPWLDLWGFESPALTASLAIGQHILKIIKSRI
tara:strand:+ start:786 stop:1886 length:1101 start_codon:yes stop_codon:yes gene_type:complete